MDDVLHSYYFAISMQDKNMLRFSGHDTFHCKEQWLLKGYENSSNQYNNSTSDNDIVSLGVGKNMVRAISHWSKSFGIKNINNEITDFADLIFSSSGFDKYLEDEATLWLLHFRLCNSNYASIYHLIFSEYFRDKASLEFTESQVISFLERTISKAMQRAVSPNTLLNDFKVFLKTYAQPLRNEKTIEDDFNAPLQVLNLIEYTSRKNANNESIYYITRREDSKSISTEIFGFCLLESTKENVVSFDELKQHLGSYLCLTNEGLEHKIERLCSKYPSFVYKDDAGIKQVQIKDHCTKFQNHLLSIHYAV